eukprot:TRINITY_DN8202_c0_g1_i1.p1 TRINITY_DN8202_c0_g1~~TRINITY_DN8202_c0_g1_i1.p1  ORF type:complete len:529 (+),score=111.32 TRINITY_DN8202_c0_g1_i1:95-1681(+)
MPAKKKSRKVGNSKPKKVVSHSVSTADLEAIVFGGAAFAGDAAASEEQDNEAPDVSDEDEENKNSSLPDDDVDVPKKKRNLNQADDARETKPRAAWNDPDDAALRVDMVGGRQMKRQRGKAEATVAGDEYERRLRQNFVKLNGNARWADAMPLQADESSDSEDDEEMQPKAAASSARPVAGGSPGGFLKPGQLEVKKLKELPFVGGMKKGPAAIEALQFHPSSELLLTAGRDKTLRLYAVDGEENLKVASYHFKQFPILGASFTPTGDQVIMTSSSSQIWGLDVRSGEPFEVRNISSGGRSAFRCLTMGPSPSQASGLRSSQMYSVQGEGGQVMLCDLQTKHTIRTMRMSAPGVASLFALDRDALYTADAECNIYEWDLGTGRCRQKVKDAWAMQIQCLAIRGVTDRSPKPLLAVGTSTGNIDLLDVSGPKMSGTPVQSIANLTTRIDGLRFHPEGEVLAGCSRMKKGALKVIHSATATVFQNWPTQKTPLHRVTAVDFSRQGGIMAMGNENGRVLLYRLRHYEHSAA